jgi:hypothetical protein
LSDLFVNHAIVTRNARREIDYELRPEEAENRLKAAFSLSFEAIFFAYSAD